MNLIIALSIREIAMLALIVIETAVIAFGIIRKAARRKRHQRMLEALRTPEAKKAQFDDILRQTANLHA